MTAAILWTAYALGVVAIPILLGATWRRGSVPDTAECAAIATISILWPIAAAIFAATLVTVGILHVLVALFRLLIMTGRLLSGGRKD